MWAKMLGILSMFAYLSCASNNKIIPHSIPGVVKIKKDTIFLKSGIVTISKTINIPSNTVVYGNNTTIHFSEDIVFPLINISSASNVTFANVTIEGSPLSMSKHTKQFLEKAERKWFLQIWNSSNINVINCKFKNSYGTTVHVSDCENMIFEKCNFKDIGLPTSTDFSYSYDAIFLGGYVLSKNITINSCQFSNVGFTFPNQNQDNLTDGDGVHIQAAGEIEDINITNCLFERCGARGVKIQSGKNININDNRFIDNSCSVVMAMVKTIYNINCDNNYTKNSSIVYSSETMGERIFVEGLSIKNNIVEGKCTFFLRTGGSSNIKNGIFDSNTIDDNGLFVFSGRFINSKITNNTVKSFGSRKHSGYNMAFEIIEESDNLTIENNKLGKFDKSNTEITNYSKNIVIFKNNTFQISKTKNSSSNQ